MKLTGIWFVLLGFIFGCSSEDEKQEYKDIVVEKEVLDTSDFNNDPSSDLNAVQTFGEDAHRLLRENCRGCHDSQVAPYFATEDTVTSFNVIMAAKKIDLQDPEKSRVVSRLAEDKHNCWSECSENAKELVAAIEAVAVQSKNAIFEDLNFAFVTKEVDLSNLTASGEPPENNLVFPAVDGAIEGKAQEETDPKAQAGKSIVLSKTVEDYRKDDFTTKDNEPETGVLMIPIRRHKESSNKLAIRLAVLTWERTKIALKGDRGEAVRQLDLRPGRDTKGYFWVSISLDRQGFENDTMNLKLWASDAAIRIDRFVLVAKEQDKSPLDDLEAVKPQNQTFFFPLTADGTKEFSMSVMIKRMNETSFLISDLTIRSPSGRTKAKGFFPITEGSFKPANGVYSMIEVDVANTPMVVASEAASTILYSDASSLRLSFGIKEISIAEKGE